ncbi:hypothetical protein G7046_g1849 [Stylonectria norvegica]|nr:hypothetical protein G7046_g1849 [Stylonectria norvegica]
MALDMRALVLHGPDDLRLSTVAKPVALPGSVVVSVQAAPIWDYVPDVVQGMRGYPLAYPLIFGTSCVGRVEEVGPDVTALKPGQLVFCDYLVRLRDQPSSRIVLGYHGGFAPEERALAEGHWRNGCFAEYASFPPENVHVLDEQLLSQQNIKTDSLAEIATFMAAMGALNSINVKPGDTVLVLPATGFFSSSVVSVALSLGAKVVAGSRNEDELKRMVSSLGDDSKHVNAIFLSGDAGVDAAALRAATPGGRGADAYVDYSPPAAAKTTHIVAGIMALKRYGRCCFAGVIIDNVALPYAVIMSNCISIQGSFAQNRSDVVQTIRLIEAGRLVLRKTIAGDFGLSEHSEAFRLAKVNRGWEKMIIFKPGKTVEYGS